MIFRFPLFSIKDSVVLADLAQNHIQQAFLDEVSGMRKSFIENYKKEKAELISYLKV